MRLTVIGTGTVAPSRERTAAAYWVESGSVKLLMDCGAGTMHRCAHFGIAWEQATHVAITHFHLDHWGELPMLLFAGRWGTLPPRTAPLTVIGPVGFKTRMVVLAGALGDWVLDPGYPLDLREIEPGGPVELAPGVTLEAQRTPTHTAESLAYSVRADGARLVYTGDTGPDDALARWAMGCDTLVSECSLPDDKGISIHLTPTQAGALARDAQAKRLVLTHFYPQVEGTDPAGVARRQFPGDVVAANDGDRFTIGR